MFQDNNIATYTDVDIGYTGKFNNDIIPRITVRTLPNQKPWVNREVRAKLKAWTNTYNSGDLEYRKSMYMLRKAMLLRDNTGTKWSLTTRENNSPAEEVQKAQEDPCSPVMSKADVCRSHKRINTHKEPGLDGVPGRALKVSWRMSSQTFSTCHCSSL